MRTLYRYTRYWSDGSICERKYYGGLDTPTCLKEVFKDTEVYPFIEIKEVMVRSKDFSYCEGCDTYVENNNIAEYKGYDYCKECIEDEMD